MLITDLNFIVTNEEETLEFPFPEGSRFRYFVSGGEGNYSIVTSPRFVEFRIPIENNLGLMNKINSFKKINKIILIDKVSRAEILSLGTEEMPLGYPAISIMNDDVGKVDEIMSIPFETALSNDKEGE